MTGSTTHSPFVLAPDHVLQRVQRQFGVGVVSQRIDADQIQHVDLSLRCGFEDRGRVPAGRGRHRSAPDRFDLGAVRESRRRLHPGTGSNDRRQPYRSPRAERNPRTGTFALGNPRR